MNENYYIYTHTSPSGKVYVGQTKNIRNRWGTKGEHYRTKKEDGTYIQPSFARALDKYGWKSFEHKIILENISKSEADYAEKYLIKWYKLHNMSYNIASGGEGCDAPRPPLTEEQRRKISERLLENHPMRGKHWSPEQLKKITEANRNRVYTPEQRAAMAERARLYNTGRTHSEEFRKKISDYKKAHPETWIGGWNKKEVYQYDLEGNYIQSFDSAEAAARSIGKKSCGDICNCINNKCASAHGYIWKTEKLDSVDVSNYRIVKTAHGARLISILEDDRLRRSAAHGKAVNQYSINGKYIATFCTASEASRQTGASHSTILHCCKHDSRSKTAGSYRWEYDTVENRGDLAA